MRSATLILGNVSQIPGAEATMYICTSVAYRFQFSYRERAFEQIWPFRLVVTGTVRCLAKFYKTAIFISINFWAQSSRKFSLYRAVRANIGAHGGFSLASLMDDPAWR